MDCLTIRGIGLNLGKVDRKYSRLIMGPLILKIDRQHWTTLKSTGTFEKYRHGTLSFLKIDRRHWTILKSTGTLKK